MIEPEILIKAYSEGIFPMANDSGEIHWYESNPRAILDIKTFKIPRDLKRILNRNSFEIYFDRSFEKVMRCCSRREPTWISEEIISSYVRLHQYGFAHSIEAWQEDKLVGGLYGVTLGGAFFGESMFHHVSNASKVSLVHLAQHLKDKNFLLHDAQIMTPTLKLFGAKNIFRDEYMDMLKVALKKRIKF